MKHRAGIALIICLLLLAWFQTGKAQQQLQIIEVVVEGNRVATRSLIMGVSSLDVGTTLSPTAVSETIRRLYGLGIFSEISIEADNTNDGVIVYIIVDELPKLSGLEFNGNKEIKTKELKETLGLVVGGYISYYLIEKNKNDIYNAYAEKGYFQAEIDPSLNYNADSSEAILIFTINEKSKIKVEKVIISGTDRIKADDLIGKMRNRKRGFLKSSNFAQDKFDEDLEKVIAEYHKKGFIDAYLISDSLSIDTTRNRMTVYLEVYEGPQYYFGDVTYDNNVELSDEILSRVVKFQAGDIFNSEKYDETMFELASAYYEIGHLHIQIIDDRNTRADSIVDVSYTITEGLPSYVNMVRIVGNRKTKEKVIRREIDLFPGQKFNRSLLIRSVRDIMSLNYFSNVEPVPIDLPNGDVDLEFNIEEKQTGQISAGAGYNSQDKVVGNFGMGIPNFRGNGQNLSFNVEFGNRRNSFSLSFTEPWLFGRPTLLGINAYLTNRRWYNDYTEGRTGGSLRLGRRLRWPDNYFRIFTSYSLERNKFYDFDDSYINQNSYKSQHYYDDPASANRNDLLLDQNRFAPYPGSILQYDEKPNTASRLSFTIIRDSRNLPEFATKGSRVSYTIENTGGILGGYWKSLKHDISVAKFFPLFGGFALAAKVQWGMVTSSKGDNRILLTDRYTPGGTNYDGIIRGYDDGSLTPDSIVNQSDTSYYYIDPNSIPGIDTPEDTTFESYRTRVRGKYMLVSNIELQVPISQGQLYGILFFDAGNSWLHSNDIKPLSSLYKSAGIGFRIVVPAIGTIGFDFGYAFDKADGQDKGWKPHFQVGTTFR